MKSASNLKIVACAGAMLCIIATARLSSAAPLYVITELAPPSGATNLIPYGINNQGQIVGAVYFPSTVGGFSYHGNTATVLSAPTGHSVWRATSVNDLGQIVGNTTSSQGIPKSAFWASESDTAPQVLESGGGPDANVYATGINNSTAISGYFTGSGSGNTASWRAVRWALDNNNRLKQRVVTTGVAPLPAGVFHAAFGINNLGELAGSGAWIDPDISTSQAAIKWSAIDVASELAGIASFVSASYQAEAINDAGVCVGKLNTWFGEAHALRWASDNSVTELGVLPGFTDGDAVDINSAGQIVGTHSGGGASVAALFTSGAWIDLNAHIVGSPGWQLQSAVGINDTGWIIGTGTHNTNSAGYLLKPTVVADLDHDADVDLADFVLFRSCASRSGVAPSTGCEDRDFDHDIDVDPSDFGVFQRCYSGAGVTPKLNCAD